MQLAAFRTRFNFLIITLLTVTLSGCAVNNSHLPEAPENVTPAAQRAPQLPPYYIQIGDILELKMLLNPEFDQEIVVRPDGMISTVLAQNIPAYGQTPQQLQDRLAEIYKDQLSNPQLSVLVKSFTPTRVYVLGEVSSPGEFVSVGPSLTLLQALARAGGVKPSANTESITILRRGASDEPQAFRANMESAISGVDPAADVRLAPYDVVYVPRSGVAEVYKNFNQYLQQFVPASFGLSYSLNSGD